MQNEFKIEKFKPKQISHSKDILDRHLRQVIRTDNETKGNMHDKEVKLSLWQKILNLFKSSFSS